MWRVPRARTARELVAMIDHLPCEIRDVNVYFHAERLEEARREEWLRFELRATR